MQNPFDKNSSPEDIISTPKLSSIFDKSTNKPTIPVKKTSKLKTFFKIASLSLLVLLLLTSVAGFYLYQEAYKPYQEFSQKLQQTLALQPKVKEAIASKDLNKIKLQLEELKQAKESLQTSYQKFSKFSKLPKIKDYYQDGEEAFNIADQSFDASNIILTAIAPYQDFLGLTGGLASKKTETAEDRIAFLTQSVEGIVPYFDQLETKLSNIETSLNKIDATRYPEEFKGLKIQSNLLQVKQEVAQIHQFLQEGKPILTKTSWLLGKDKPRTYLLLFQNDAELRPTGGFWTAYGTLKVDKGKITPISSSNIYDLDTKFNSTIPAPRPIKSYHINVPYWYVRDMNLSPDFPTSVKNFIDAYNKVYKNDPFDAVVAITTKPVVDLIKVIGRVGVPGWGNFTPDPDKRCDGCPNVLYQMLWLAGKPRNYVDNDRKGFLGPLMHSILANAMGSPKEKMGPLMSAMLENVNQKNILMYFKDPEMQKAAELANIAGTVTQTTNNTDYIMLVDANMSSAKTNLFLTQKIRHEIISQNGQVQHKITITYTNPSKASNCNLEKGDICLNAPKYRDWFRFYVPTNSKLDKMTGSEVDPLTYEESGKTVFEGFYGNKYPLYAQSSTKTSIQYTSTVPASKDYTLLIQKQPGAKAAEYQLVVNGEDYDTFMLTADKTIKLAL